MPRDAIVLFDGVCNLCNRFVQFIIAHDSGARFHFASLQSEAAHRLLSGLKEPRPLPDSLVLLEGDRVLTQSAAALRIARGLALPWPLAYALVVVPRPIRDYVYDVVARNRYRWFGRREVCMAPSSEIRARFLE